MTRILTIFLSLHWMVVYALEAARALDLGNASHLSGIAGFGTLAIPVVHAVIAALFLWLIAALVSDGDEYPGDGADVSRIAFAGALGVTTAAFVFGDAAVAGEMPMRLAGLLGSYIVIHMDRSLGAVPPQMTRGHRAARVMAIGAASQSLLSRIAKPHPANRTGF